MNAMDILIEEAKAMIKTWGGDEPDFLLCSSKLCLIPRWARKDRNSRMCPTARSFFATIFCCIELNANWHRFEQAIHQMDEGLMPRDLMRRRVRVAEHYVVTRSGQTDLAQNWVQLYNESSDDFQTKTFQDLWDACRTQDRDEVCEKIATGDRNRQADIHGFLLIRKNIEHYMLGMIVGRGGLDYLGATLWGQPEMSVFDDGQHGVWGMTYKYHERAIVFNERNMHRMWDIAYDGYVGGKELDLLHFYLMRFWFKHSRRK